jgi:beta-lactamase regulating signal transducer with metallopeptidase domain
VHEHLARAMYYWSVQLLFASPVALAMWALTSVMRASATTKYWIWVATGFNIAVPSGALVDKLWASHFTWAKPLGVIGGPVWDMTYGRTAAILGLTWLTGAVAMLVRLVLRIVRERREARMPALLSHNGPKCDFLADGIQVSFGDKQSGPAVVGVFRPRILLPAGIDRLLDSRELNAVLIHEIAHARRRDNLIRVLYESALCALWFHPLMWLAGARMGLYRELSCDESVVRLKHGRELVTALAKLAAPKQSTVLQATATSHLRYRLASLAGPPPTRYGATSLLLFSMFGMAAATGIFETIAHTACCFVLKH